MPKIESVEEHEDASSTEQLHANLYDALSTISTAAAAYTVFDAVISRVAGRRLAAARLSAPDISFLINSVLAGLTGARVIFGSTFNCSIHAYPEWIHRGVGAFAGYMAYDLAVLYTGHGGGDLLPNGTVLAPRKPSAELLVHHVMAFLGSLGSMTFRQANFFPTATLFTELSLISVFAAQRARDAVPRDSGKYLTALKARLICTLLFRTFVVPFTIFRAYRVLGKAHTIDDLRDGLGFLATARRAWRRFRAQTTGFVRYATLTNLVVFTGLNALWTVQIARTLAKEMAKTRTLTTPA
ncbi:hypothetical protein PYCC9005_000074 [Savitreella phatthalungensis]